MCLQENKNPIIDFLMTQCKDGIENSVEIQRILEEMEYLTIPDGVIENIYKNIILEIKKELENDSCCVSRR